MKYPERLIRCATSTRLEKLRSIIFYNYATPDSYRDTKLKQYPRRGYIILELTDPPSYQPRRGCINVCH